MNLRSAKTTDIPAMIALERATDFAGHWSYQSYHEAFEKESPQRLALIVEDDIRERANSLQGFLLARINAPECEVENIVVGSGFQRRGLGTKLMQALVDASRDLNIESIFLEVRESNLPARMLYEKCGFGAAGRRKSYYRDSTEDALLYTLQL